MSKQKKHILSLELDFDYQMIGICSHHSDYRLIWSINESFEFHFAKANEDYVVVNKKGQKVSEHSLYEYKDEDNFTDYYMIKNKSFGKFLIPEKPSIDYFLFIVGAEQEVGEAFSKRLKGIPSVLAIFQFEPDELESTEHIIF